MNYQLVFIHIVTTITKYKQTGTISMVVSLYREILKQFPGHNSVAKQDTPWPIYIYYISEISAIF